MTKLEMMLYDGVPDEELPDDIRERRRRSLEGAAKEEKPPEIPDINAAEFSEKELKSPLSTALGYARTLKNENATEKGRHDNADYGRAIIIIILSMIAVYVVFGILVRFGLSLIVPPN